MATAGKKSSLAAISAAPDYLEFGKGVSRNFGFVKHLTIAMTAGMALGFLYKTWHWNEKRYIAQYYAELSKKEAKEEAARAAALQAKFKELEAELLS